MPYRATVDRVLRILLLSHRPPARVSGLEPLKNSGSGALLNSLAPIEPHGFDPHLLDKESLCVGSGISRGPAITR